MGDELAPVQFSWQHCECFIWLSLGYTDLIFNTWSRNLVANINMVFDHVTRCPKISVSFTDIVTRILTSTVR